MWNDGLVLNRYLRARHVPSEAHDIIEKRNQLEQYVEDQMDVDIHTLGKTNHRISTYRFLIQPNQQIEKKLKGKKSETHRKWINYYFNECIPGNRSSTIAINRFSICWGVQRKITLQF